MGSLDRLIELARHASPMDRLRLERTIAVILRAQRAVLLSHQAEQHAWKQLTQAKAASQRRREKDEGPPVELYIFGERPPGSGLSIRLDVCRFFYIASGSCQVDRIWYTHRPPG
jgi:hypothetical protein